MGTPIQIMVLAGRAESEREVRGLLEGVREARCEVVDAGVGLAELVPSGEGIEPPDCVIVVHEPPRVDALAALEAWTTDGLLRRCAVVVIADGRSVRRAASRAGAMACVARRGLDEDDLWCGIEDAIDRFAAQPFRALQRLADTLPALVAHIDSGARYLFVNHVYARQLGRDAEDLVGAAVGDVLGPDNYRKTRPHLEAALGGEEVHFEEELSFCGVRRQLDLRYVPERRADGTIGGCFVLGVDITERKRSEAALRESEERFRQLADAMPQLVWTAGDDGIVRYYNSRVAHYDGVRRIGEGQWLWQPVVHPDETEQTVAAWEAAVASGSSYQFEHRLRMADGTYRWHLSRAVRVRSGDGSVQWFGTATDIHELKAAEEALREADRRKDEFLAMLGHELRNPLAAIRNATQLLELVDAEDPRVRRVHGVLERQSTQMARLIDGLLEVSRIARGKIALEPQAVDLREVLEGVLHDQVTLGEGLEVERRLPASPVWISGDPVRLAQVFDNLVGNAVKFTRAQGRVTVELRREGAQAVVRVRDTGIGIPPEVLPHVFEPFHQATSGDRATGTGGLGLGLALAKGLVELHGGTIEAHSRGVGTGTELRVKLPLGVAPCEEERAAAPASTATRRILVVEDNVDAAETLRDVLELKGHQVAVVENAPDAIAALRDRPADIVLCDIGLPGMSGCDLAREIRADPAMRSVVLVALTGYGQPEDRDRTREAGFDVHLTKPVDLQALDGVLARVA